MIYKRCVRCGKRIPSGTTCDCTKREYNKPQGIKKQYHTQRWRRIRDYVINLYDGIDLYALYHEGKVQPADTVHHIIEAADSPSMFYHTDNLIPVSRDSHTEIHRRYKECDTKIKEELKAYLLQYREYGGG
ncbi:HNH endonuclease [Zhenpiania hominis]|uniref:HNH endonuclease n=1 Tax=Zhenpiania hominis TaxID=2763644 RepID=A0A923SXG6_9FIRM|nr:HNH endonuclease [Zhenpiania hominis]MBC6681328.1 HNH endonuclease [Zhenpiania hominis]